MAISFSLKIDPQSINAYRYLRHFDPMNKAGVNLFEKVEELNPFRGSKAPQWLLDHIQSMDASKRDAFDILANMPAALKFIPGVAACGKSSLPQNVIIAALFGCSPATSAPAESKHRRKVLYCVNNNAAVDTFAKNPQGKKKCNAWALTNELLILFG